MVADIESGDGADPMEDAEAWQALSREEQSDLLDEGIRDLRGEAGEGAFRHLSDQEKSATIGAIERDGGTPPDELSETERAMQEALQSTYEVVLWEGVEETPSIPFECLPLTATEREKLDEAIQFVMRVEEEATSPDDIDELDVDSEHFDSPAEINDWLPVFLADVTVDDAFGEERWRSGRRLRAGTRQQLLLEIYLKHRTENERALKFRAEQGG